jgi:transcription antitermination factor NusG
MSVILTSPVLSANSAPREPLLTAQWCAIQTRPRHEKVVKYSLESVGIEAFLPVCPQIRSWSDRRKVVEFPLFPGYIFARANWSLQVRVRVFQTNGVIAFVGPRKEATPIPDQQIDAVPAAPLSHCWAACADPQRSAPGFGRNSRSHRG